MAGLFSTTSSVTAGGLTATYTTISTVGAIAAGAVAGVAGAVASQVVGLATGIQSKVDWKGIALAGISGGIGAGLSGLGKIAGSAFLGNVVRGAASSALTQGVAVATGLQKTFDWASVATAGVVSGVVGGINRTLASNGIGTAAGDLTASTPHNVGFYANQALSGMAGAIAGAATRSVLTGSDFGDNLRATLPDVIGATVGNLLGDSLVSEPRETSMARLRRLQGGVEYAQTAADPNIRSDSAPGPDIVIIGHPMTWWEKAKYDALNPFDAIDRYATGAVEEVKYLNRTYVRPVAVRIVNTAIRYDPRAVILDTFGDHRGAAMIRGSDRGVFKFAANTVESGASLGGDLIKALPRFAGNAERGGLTDAVARVVNRIDPMVSNAPLHLPDKIAAQFNGIKADLSSNDMTRVERGASNATSDILTVASVVAPLASAPRALGLVNDLRTLSVVGDAADAGRAVTVARSTSSAASATDWTSASAYARTASDAPMAIRVAFARAQIGETAFDAIPAIGRGPIGLIEPTGASSVSFVESGGLRFAGSRGIRNTEALSDIQQSQILTHVDELGLSRSDFRISSHISAYSDNFDMVFIGPNAFPASVGDRVGGTVFERMTPRAVVAHEAGHMFTTRAGTSFEAGSLADEIGASLTGRRLPGLTDVERYQLLRDAAERAANHGTTVRNVLRGY